MAALPGCTAVTTPVTAFEIVEDAASCLCDHGRQLVLDELLAAVAVEPRRRPVKTGVVAVHRQRRRLLPYAAPDLDVTVARLGRQLLFDAMSDLDATTLAGGGGWGVGSFFTRRRGDVGSRLAW